MRISLSEFRALLTPFRQPGYFRAHTIWHLLGGVVLYALFGSVWLAVVVAALRQEFMREAKGPGEFPLYAMVWDTAASGAASALCALLWRLR